MTANTTDINALKAAADSGDADAQFKYGNACASGTQGVIKDENEAVCYWRDAEQQGHPDATCALADAYGKGKGVTQDQMVARDLWRKAAMMGVAKAQLEVGRVYEFLPKGVHQDTISAYIWYLVAAANGNKEAVDRSAKLESQLNMLQVHSARDKAEEWLNKINKSK